MKKLLFLLVYCILVSPIFAQITMKNVRLKNVNVSHAPSPKVDILMIGDSIAQGTGGKPPIDFYVEDNYPDGLNYFNMGIGGNRYDQVEERFERDAVAFRPNAVLIHCGTNDISYGKDFDDVEPFLDSILDKTLVSNIKLCVAEVLPRNDGININHDIKIENFNIMLSSWCNTNNVTLLACHDSLMQIGNEPRPEPTYFNTDLLHPNSTGNKVVADAYFSSYMYLRSDFMFNLPQDTDNDGMPDDWELTNNLNPFVYNANDDDDNDGLNNIFEFANNTNPLNNDTDNDGLSDGDETVAGTSPTDKNSVFKIHIIRCIEPSGAIELTWQISNASNRIYRIYWKDDADNSFWDEVDYEDLAEDIHNNGDGTKSWVDLGKDPEMNGVGSSGTQSRFYQIGVNLTQ